MTENHPITPPPELVQQWKDNWVHGAPQDVGIQEWLVTKAAQWGADQELEACCDHIRDYQWGFVDPPDGTRMHRAIDLQLARRPKPLSLAKKALIEFESHQCSLDLNGADTDLLRAALERLQELEKGDD